MHKELQNFQRKVRSKNFEQKICLVLVTNDVGEIEMYNIKSAKRIYTFDILQKKVISSLIPTPHLHVVGVGTQDGTFQLISLKTNEIILKLNQASPITAVDCRTDVPLVAVGTVDGKISIWDLEHMQLVTQVSREIEIF